MDSDNLLTHTLELIRAVQLKAEDAARNQTALINTLEEIMPTFSEAYHKHYYELHGAYIGSRATSEVDDLLRPLQRTS